MATLLKTDGTKVEDRYASNKPTLEQLQKDVGGYIEPIYLDRTKEGRAKLSGRILWVNEEGNIHQLPENKTASRLAGFPIVGNAVLVESGK